MDIDFEKMNGLVPAIIQDSKDKNGADAWLYEQRGF